MKPDRPAFPCQIRGTAFLPVLLILSLVGLLTGCTDRPASTGLYYWKTVLAWTDTDTARCAAAGVDRIGLRLFDWGTRGAEGPLLVRSPLPGSIAVVPVVYVTVGRLEAWAADSRLDPAREARLLMDTMAVAFGKAWPGTPTAWQLDADWSARTQASWFAVAGAFRNLVHQKGGRFEVTVRLHQYRDRNTQGIPPADGGVLMLYGTGDQILDQSLAEGYLRGPAYPIPLVPAFPVYTQVRQYNGYGKLVALHRLGAGTPLPAAALEETGPGRYEVLRRADLGDRPLMARDTLTVDRVEPGVLAGVSALPPVGEMRRRAGDRVWVFDYDSSGWEALVHGPLAPYLFPR